MGLYQSPEKRQSILRNFLEETKKYDNYIGGDYDSCTNNEFNFDPARIRESYKDSLLKQLEEQNSSRKRTIQAIENISKQKTFVEPAKKDIPLIIDTKYSEAIEIIKDSKFIIHYLVKRKSNKIILIFSTKKKIF